MAALTKPIHMLVNRPGYRPIVTRPSTQWRYGPFYVDALVDNGTATSVDLTTHDAWYGDIGARQAYSLTDGSTTKVQATVHIEWISVLFLRGEFTELDANTKDHVHEPATEMYIEATVAGGTEKYGLIGAMREAIAPSGAATTVAATTIQHAMLQGGRRLLDFPVRINLEVDQLWLKSIADVALGADEPVKVVLGGILLPKSANVPGAISGASCAPDTKEGTSFTLNEIRNVEATSLQLLSQDWLKS